jgi:SnoaL-like domain
MTDNERLMAIEAIKQLKARYFRCMDTKQWNGWNEVFTADALMDVSEERPPGSQEGPLILNGAEKIISTVSKLLEGVVTVHHGHMPEIEVTSDTTARGIWSMEDKLRWPDGKTTLHGYGHYHETYEKAGGNWRIKTLKLTRLRVDRT